MVDEEIPDDIAPTEKPYDASDPKSVNEARIKAGRKKRNQLEVVEAIMSQPQGRKWMYDLLEMCGVFRNPMVYGDPHNTSENCGKQAIGHWIQADIMNAAPDQYMPMCTEGRKLNKVVKELPDGQK